MEKGDERQKGGGEKENKVNREKGVGKAGVKKEKVGDYLFSRAVTSQVSSA